VAIRREQEVPFGAALGITGVVDREEATGRRTVAGRVARLVGFQP
jgi:hypothetical protein